MSPVATVCGSCASATPRRSTRRACRTGVAKVGWLARDRGPETVAAMRALKAAWDPAGVLNPGVLFESSLDPTA
ncbi:MAG: hypothetical protein LC798_21865 [Chloroflexi bacterium]|nr:hypothetical protein [Chloroflexota bacterium]